MLRGESSNKQKALAWGLAGLVGAAAASLVLLGNPGNMGICGACFLRDMAGALGLFAKGPACFRPEIVGLMLGACLWMAVRRRFEARSGSYAAARFALGFWMAVGALVFLGCPFRLLQRLGGGDLNAWYALPGFVAGVGLALLLERRGYNIGKTTPVPGAVGWLGPLAAAGLLVLFLLGGQLLGPGTQDAAGKPPHAPWHLALGIAVAAGAILSATGFCAVSAVRQIFQPRKTMLLAALALMAAYALGMFASGNFKPGSSGQPIAHGELIWNGLALALLGLTGALAGGCPVRQVIMAGEGNGDAWVCVCGIAVGGAVCHNLGWVSNAAAGESSGGATTAGAIAVGVGLAFTVLYGLCIVRQHRIAPAAASN